MKKVIILLTIITIAAIVYAYSPSYLSFNNGQVSPLLEARVDYEKYNTSCRTVENMLITVHGPAERRPGTKYIYDVFKSGDYGYGAYGEGLYGE